MSREILLNAFDMSCAGHISHGMWAHPRDRSADYKDIEYWTRLATLLERGLFDGLFIADIVGLYDVYQGSPDAALRSGAQTPLNDPLLVVSAMAAVTKHLGFGVTVNLTYEQPYIFARRMSTLDHLSKGRLGWNIVTGYLDSAARGAGLEKQPDHDHRYDVADDFMEVVYKLWETSWDDDAVVRDRAARIFSRPEKVRRVRHDGPYYRVDAIHLSEPSPQRTPVLYQAGSSTRGRAFAGRHAECVFVFGPNRQAAKAVVAGIRDEAERQGRGRDAIKVFAGITVVAGETEAAAKAKLEDYRAYASIEGGLAHMSGSTGVDFARYGLDEPIRHERNDANNSALEAITTRSTDSAWTRRRLEEQMVLGSRARPIVGSAQQVADELERWVDEADVDGFNLIRTVTPESIEDFIDLVVPELQRRGRYKRTYADGTLREKLFGSGRARLPAEHLGGVLRARSAASRAA